MIVSCGHDIYQCGDADQIISKEEAMTALMDYNMNNGRSIKIQWDQLY